MPIYYWYFEVCILVLSGFTGGANNDIFTETHPGGGSMDSQGVYVPYFFAQFLGRRRMRPVV